MKINHIIISALAAAIPAGTAAAVPSGDVRVAWDHSTMRDITSIAVDNRGYVENNLIYPRIKRMSNGQLMMSFMNNTYGWEPYVALSDDNGQSWHHVQRLQDQKQGISSAGDDTFVYVNPDFIELANGDILLAYQCRWKKGYNDLEHTNENCFIETMVSHDKGLTWDAAKRVYTGRCWEPAMLQLPSGEIQMYITDSNDVRYKRSQPCTIVIRSFDNGKTWQGKPECSYRDGEVISRTIDERGSYDGMPSAVILNDGAIAVPLEVWSGVLKMDQTPVIVVTDKATNWHSDQSIRRDGGPGYPAKRQIHKDLQAYGPYITRLPEGEPIVISSGKYKGQQGMWVLVGDCNADNFNHATSPFQGYWGSIDYIGDNKVMAASTFDYKDDTGTKRHMVKTAIGRINRSKTLRKGMIPDPAVPASFDSGNNSWWFLGAQSPTHVFNDFGYDDNGFVIAGALFDTELRAFTPDNSDASGMLIGRDKGNGEFDIFRTVVNAEGKYNIYRQQGTSWVLIDSGVTPVKCDGTVNDSSDSDKGFTYTLRIPWDKLGGIPAKGEKLRLHPRLHYKTTEKEGPVSATFEEADGENTDYPSEWLSATLE